MKKCSKCKEEKPLASYYRLGKGHRPDCKKCSDIYRRSWEKRNPTSTFKYHIKGRYGITEDELSAMRASQNDLCAICKRGDEKLHIDHDHITNKFRGLLCGLCNRGLGMFRDNANLLTQAIDYLREMS